MQIILMAGWLMGNVRHRGSECRLRNGIVDGIGQRQLQATGQYAMATTNWSDHWQHFVLIDGKEIPVADFHRQRKYEALSPDAKTVLGWLSKSKQSNVTLVQMSKCLTPPALRTYDRIRQIMKELVAGGFAQAAKSPVYYSGRWRQEAWAPSQHRNSKLKWL